MPSYDRQGRRLSGAAQQKAKRAREKRERRARVLPEARRAEAEFVEAARDLGPAPTDPTDAVVYGAQMCTLVLRSAAVDPESPRLAARRRAVLDAVRALGLTNSKAVDKKLMKRLAERLGLVPEDPTAHMEPCPPGKKALRG